MVVFVVKSNENTYPKVRALLEIYRVVPITNRGNTLIMAYHLFLVNRHEAVTVYWLVLFVSHGWP